MAVIHGSAPSLNVPEIALDLVPPLVPPPSLSGQKLHYVISLNDH